MQTLSVLAFSLTAVAGFAPTIRLAPRTVAPVSVVSPIQMNFFDDMQRNFAKMMGQDAPSIDEAMEMCRDDESSGCTLEMLDLIAQEKGAAPPAASPRWSKEIDDAVVKPE